VSAEEPRLAHHLPSRRWLIVALLALIGLGITTYLTSTALSHTEVGCSLSGCNTVLTSKWSKIFGVPVSAFGMVTYGVIMLGALHAHKAPNYDMRGRLPVVAAVVVGVGASIYLTIVEFFVIKAFCQYCLSSAVLIVLTAIAVGYAAHHEPPLWRLIGPSLRGVRDRLSEFQTEAYEDA
jgi:uncharacterized membrane protein